MVSPTDERAREIIRAIVRGECERSELTPLGIKVSRYDDIWEIDNPKGIFVEVPVEDLARGLIAYKDNPTLLQPWAALVLSGSSFIGLESLNLRTDGDELLGALWDAAYECRYSEKAFLIASDILSSARGKNRN